MNYIIHRDNKPKKIVKEFEPVIPFQMKPHFRNRTKMLDIEQISIINAEIKKTFCSKQCNYLFRRITSIYLSVQEDDATEGDMIIALNEVARAKLLLKDEYAQFLSKQEMKEMLRRFTFVEEKLKEFLQFRMQIMKLHSEDSEIKGKSR